ncbi:M10 family metallopeptidase C-terminal domain-containing protein, partial [Sphingorhabdus sp.]|uniref:M10 family metallopeptidase C-terminal domain-containing protein n=1 Tax=Sphingorhabdus sp. TaxID=1902408 RepID=UPI004053D263
ADTITGGATTDTLSGGAGADVISGGAGVDVITGGTGADTLTGGAGVDVFQLTLGDSTLATMDVITDFSGDSISYTAVADVAGTVATVQDFSAQTSLGAALNAAAASNATDLGQIAFIFGGNTYLMVETVGSGNAYVATDAVLQITGTPFTTSTALTSIFIA